MDDPLLVGGGEAACNLDGRVGRTRNRHRPGRGRLPQRLASEELDDEVVPPLVHARVVDLENVRVGQGDNRFGFPSNRERRPGFPANDSGRTLIATARSRRASRAR